MVSEYKEDLGKEIYESTKEKINNANVQEVINDKPKKRVIRKRV